ncbi:regulatory protein YycI of two-component signal transduction system YycFG [Planomicrobium stackebrandtii]|uniref:Regulatory protein YycI of two-component signal transduction system YycFG n=1 Tax=Planomicrobium stackebrandtii TaxID=253160 RepID=A0ABU0GV08_9BACL|nr:two-component system regulatory protein YycI [Planomicrobium stackebrandtii]MDQ0429192.1 regulatory protein YycI of two-component signal transduction system YycFG [Planomicrobium stackebrandtii]
MDWNKTKSIFIIVFSILNVFLYSLYLDRYTEAENLEELSESTVDDKLDADDITYSNLPEDVEGMPYIRGETKVFTAKDAPTGNVQVSVQAGKKLQVAYEEPVSPEGEAESAEALDAFVEEVVHEGTSYELWEIDEEQNKAVYFQNFDGNTLYFSEDGKVTVYWNNDGDIVRYEQTMYTDIIENQEPKELVTAITAIHTLYQKNELERDLTINKTDLGYSVHVQVSENRQMFVPTWHIQAELSDGSREDYFVNAVKDGVLELNKEEDEPEEEEQ